MATLVDVSALSAKVVCTPDGQATHVFTLANRDAKALTVDVRVEADAGAASHWFTLVGTPRRSLGAHGADRVIVQTQLPAGTAAGGYHFRLVVSGTQGGHEPIGMSPRVAVQATAPLAAAPLRAPPARWGAPATPGGWMRRPWVWLRWMRRCFVMPALSAMAPDDAPPAPAEALAPAWLVKWGLAVGAVLFVVAVGANLASAVNSEAVLQDDPAGSGRQIPTDKGPPEHWITSLARQMQGCGTVDTDPAEVRLFHCASTSPKDKGTP